MEPFRITRRDVDDLDASLKEGRDYLRDQAKREDGPKGLFAGSLRTAGVAAGAFAAGLAYGRYGDTLDKSPVPIDLAVGLVGHTLAYFDVLGDWSERVHDVSDGFIAEFMSKMGIGYGTSLRAKHDPPLPPVTIAGQPSTAGQEQRLIAARMPSPLTEAEHAARAHRYGQAA